LETRDHRDSRARLIRRLRKRVILVLKESKVSWAQLVQLVRSVRQGRREAVVRLEHQDHRVRPDPLVTPDRKDHLVFKEALAQQGLVEIQDKPEHLELLVRLGLLERKVPMVRMDNREAQDLAALRVQQAPPVSQDL